MLADPENIEKTFVGVRAVRNDSNEVIPGAFRYRNDDSGDSVTILGGLEADPFRRNNRMQLNVTLRY